MIVWFVYWKNVYFTIPRYIVYRTRLFPIPQYLPILMIIVNWHRFTIS